MAVSKETPLSGACCRLVTGGTGSLSEWWAFQNKTLEPSGQQRQKCRAPGDFVGCITPLLGTRVYFRRICLSNYYTHLRSGQRLHSPKAAVHYAVPLELDFAAAPHILLETTDHFKAIIFKAVCIDPYCHVRVLHVQKLLAFCFLYKNIFNFARFSPDLLIRWFWWLDFSSAGASYAFSISTALLHHGYRSMCC